VRLLDRYLLRELLVPLAYCLCGFLIFYVAFDLIFQIHQYLDKQMLFLDIVEYYVLTLPELLVEQVMPVSLLLALLYALTNHSRHNELTAMRAAGVSLWRLSLPYFGVGVLFGLAVFVISEYWLPATADRAKYVLERRQNTRLDRDWYPGLDFYNGAGRRHWMSGPFNLKTSEMLQPKVTWSSPDGSSQMIDADRAVFTNGRWSFYNARVWARGSNDPGFLSGVSNAELRVDLPETPAWIKSEIKVNNLNPADAAKGFHFSIRELLRYLRLHPQINQARRAMLETQLQGLMAAPFTCLAVVLIALPFGARTGRHNVFVGVASSIFICFGYFILQRISFGLGTGGYLPPVLAAWLPNILCAAAGLALLAFYR
jgi:lipopolysaccharide export system permease protein